MASFDSKNTEDPNTPWQTKFDWQARSKYLLESGKFADCELLIGEQRQRFKCHKLQLAMASPVFEQVFYGAKKSEHDAAASSSSSSSCVEFADVNVQAFGQLLNFIYLHEIDAALFPFNKVGKLLYAAKKFKMNDFRLACLHHLSTHTWPLANILSIYNAARYHKEALLLNAANGYILAQKNELLNHAVLYSLSLDTFKDVMKLFIGSCSALVIYETVEKYCVQNKLLIASEPLEPENETKASSDKTGTEPAAVKDHSIGVEVDVDACNRSSASGGDLSDSFSCNKFELSTHENRRDKIRELCELVHFDEMSPKEFASGPAATSKLLDRDKILEILLRICKRHQCSGELFKFSALTLGK